VGDEVVRVTSELIEAGQSDRGGWTKAQLALLGVPWPPPSGWKAAVLGKAIPSSAADRFVQLRGRAGPGSRPSLF
jgi:hypothetical protein